MNNTHLLYIRVYIHAIAGKKLMCLPRVQIEQTLFRDALLCSTLDMASPDVGDG